MPSISRPHLALAYEERNPLEPEVVVLLRGFPDDAQTWDAVVAAPERQQAIVEAIVSALHATAR